MNRLKELRKTQGLTQKELGEQLNLDTSTIGKYERGVNEPSLLLCQILANSFNVTPQYLVGWTDDPHS